MKKIIFLIITLFIIACSSNRVCGGRAGRRCVEVASKIDNTKIS